MAKKQIKKEHKRFERNIEKIAEEEIQKIEKRVEIVEKEAEEVGKVIEKSLKKETVKKRKSHNL